MKIKNLIMGAIICSSLTLGALPVSALSHNCGADLPDQVIKLMHKDAIVMHGDSGSTVKRLQTYLKHMGYYEGEIGTDYDESTAEAVCAWGDDHDYSTDTDKGHHVSSYMFKQIKGSHTKECLYGCN